MSSRNREREALTAGCTSKPCKSSSGITRIQSTNTLADGVTPRLKSPRPATAGPVNHGEPCRRPPLARCHSCCSVAQVPCSGPVPRLGAVPQIYHDGICTRYIPACSYCWLYRYFYINPEHHHMISPLSMQEADDPCLQVKGPVSVNVSVRVSTPLAGGSAETLGIGYHTVASNIEQQRPMTRELMSFILQPP